MALLGIDIGSSSVKAALLRGRGIVGRAVTCAYKTRYEGLRVEVDADVILRAVAKAIREIGPGAKKADAIGLTVMAPSWVAMDKRGNAITPVVTHQDRRSIDIAMEIEAKVGRERHLQLAGNRPIPGGISSTTWAWFLRHQPAVMRKADLCGHLQTLMHRRMTNSRVVDPSNASFMGFYSTVDLGGWNEELCSATGITRHRLPQVIDADGVGGLITREAGRRFGLTHGTPMLVGCMDGSAAMLLAGARPGQLVNVCGSTDVLALCTDRPRPHERLLTRALGVGRLWLSVGTIASAGSSLLWAKEQLFRDLSLDQYFKLQARLAAKPDAGGVTFDPYLAGERAGVEQRRGAFTGMTLSTTREHLLSAIIESLARASAARLPLLRSGGIRLRREVCVTGGGLSKVLHRDWPGKWTFRSESEATLRGLAVLDEHQV